MSAPLDSYAQHTAGAIAALDTSQLDPTAAITIEQIIVNDGEVVGHYHLTFESGSASVVSGSAASPDITIRQDAETAQGLRDGSIHAQGAFLTGRLSVDGDIDKLVEYGPLLSSLLAG